MAPEHETDASAEDPETEAPSNQLDALEIEAFLVELGVEDSVIDATPPESREIIFRLASERRESDDARMRALADFRNFQRRSIENDPGSTRGLGGTGEESSPRDRHFDLALQAAETATTVDQVVTGVRMVRDEIVRAMESQGIAEITAGSGSEFEPGRHEAIGTSRRPRGT